MKNVTEQDEMIKESDDMLSEYDFAAMTGGVQGKYYRAYREGHTVNIYREDGSVDVLHYTLEEGAVMLDPTVRKYFPDSEAVNTALRGLIALVPDAP